MFRSRLPAAMLTLEDAIDLIRGTIQPLPGEPVPLKEAAGRISLERLLSPLDLPRFDNSAMDGYAVRATNLATASPDRPVVLRLSGKVAAGKVFPGVVPDGECVRIFTGSPVPDGTDAVVMQEDTRIDPAASNKVQFLERVGAWENIRLKGEDVRTGSLLVEPGDRLEPGRIGLLAAAGLTSVVVGRKPVVGLLATGSELVEGGTTPGPGQIHESNRPMLAALCEAAGAISRTFPLVPDSLQGTQSAIAMALAECDAVITSGGVSVGDFDFVKSAFENLGGRVDLWKVAVKPGKPFLCGRLEGKTLFGLPGNPVSAFVTFFLLVRPALQRMQGAGNTAPPSSMAQLAEELSNPGDRRHFMRVVLDPDGTVRSAGTQVSHALGSLAKANGLADVPARTRLSKGTQVRVLRLD